MRTFNEIEKGLALETTQEEIQAAMKFFADNIKISEGKIYVILPDEILDDFGKGVMFASHNENDGRIIGYKVLHQVAKSLIKHTKKLKA